ncbi:MAG: ThiF family adenylyltransferase [Cellvibrionaceae bacterium]
MSAAADNTFDYQEAFSRNIGWVTEDEQLVLKSKKVAIAGVGGVGGLHLLAHTRLGIGKFHISDLDIFEQGNFNRQAGAFMHTVGREKVEVMAEMAKSINPDMECTTFPSGINSENVDAFLEGVDLYIDGLDFFVLDIRREVFARCWELGIPAVTAAPLGMGTALLCFVPGKMSFEDFFRMEGCSADERQWGFLGGLSPAMLQMGYLADESRIDFKAKKGPSTPMACELCAGVAATNSLKLLLSRGEVLAAPYGLHFDAYKNKTKITWRPWGNNNPIQRVILSVLRRRLSNTLSDGLTSGSEASSLKSMTDRVQDAAIWAPSGDNNQPWSFPSEKDNKVLMRVKDTRKSCVYDLRGRASQLAAGAAIENMDIAASADGCRISYQTSAHNDQTEFDISVSFDKSDSVTESPLLPYIRVRTTQRRPLRTAEIEVEKKRRLEAVLGEKFEVIWLDGTDNRWEMAKLLFHSAKIRLITEEAYQVHKDIIDWDNTTHSETKIPAKAVGLGPLMLALMRWSLKSWKRVELLNTFAAGTIAPRLQLDLLPAYFCGSHFVLLAKEKPCEVVDYLEAGRAVQRFWLETTKLGLQFQPEMTPLIFSQYRQDEIAFTRNEIANTRAESVKLKLSDVLKRQGKSLSNAVFMGRMGYGKVPTARSTRLPLASKKIK